MTSLSDSLASLLSLKLGQTYKIYTFTGVVWHLGWKINAKESSKIRTTKICGSMFNKYFKTEITEIPSPLAKNKKNQEKNYRKSYQKCKSHTQNNK